MTPLLRTKTPYLLVLWSFPHALELPVSELWQLDCRSLGIGWRNLVPSLNSWHCQSKLHSAVRRHLDCTWSSGQWKHSPKINENLKLNGSFPIQSDVCYQNRFLNPFSKLSSLPRPCLVMWSPINWERPKQNSTNAPVPLPSSLICIQK